MEEKEKQEKAESRELTDRDILNHIYSVCESSKLSLEAKVAYSQFIGLIAGSEVPLCFAMPNATTRDGLIELARHGLVRLDIDGGEYRLSNVSPRHCQLLCFCGFSNK